MSDAMSAVLVPPPSTSPFTSPTSGRTTSTRSLSVDTPPITRRLFLEDEDADAASLPTVTELLLEVNELDALVRALGAADSAGTDVTLSATKLLLARSLLVNATLRYTEANELGLLGFGSAAGAGYRLHFEGSLAYQLSRRAVVGAEVRTKPDNLGLGDDDWMDLFAAYAPTDHLTLTAAYVDLGSIATIPDQRGAFLSAQVAF